MHVILDSILASLGQFFVRFVAFGRLWFEKILKETSAIVHHSFTNCYQKHSLASLELADSEALLKFSYSFFLSLQVIWWQHTFFAMVDLEDHLLASQL